MAHLSSIVLAMVLIAGCSTPGGKITQDEVDVKPPAVNWTEGETTTKGAPTEGEFLVEFETTAGNFKMKVHRDWAPRGAERFYRLIKNKYYDGAPFYRVVPGFMVQFGMCGDPKGTKYWNKNFPDEAVKQSNLPGLVSYAHAGPGTRSTQLFINYGNNARLDGMQFSPFAEVIEGMENVQGINSEYGEQPDQGELHRSGNKYVFKKFPNIDYIISAKLVEAEIEEKAAETVTDEAKADDGKSEEGRKSDGASDK